MRIVIATVMALGLIAGASSLSAQTTKAAKPAIRPAVRKPLTPEELARKAEADKKRLAEEILKVQAVLPDKPIVKPKKARKLLVYTGCKGFYHDSIPLGAKAIEMLGAKTGAFEATISDDPQMFAPEKLKAFDAVMIDNCTGDSLPDPALKQSLLDFVRSGKGIAGNHGAADAFYKWKEYGEMIGGYFCGHPFGQITVKIDDPKSPVNAMFKGQGFDISDEIYTFREPYSRERLHILLSIDYEKSAKVRQTVDRLTEEKKIKKSGWTPRPDNDYALSWIHEYGKGRVFYCAFGHQHYIFWNPTMLEHFLAGLQYALGDLPAEAAPSCKAAK